MWTFHCVISKPLSVSLFEPMEKLAGEMGHRGKCILMYDSAKKGEVILDRKKMPSYYGMVYDETVYLIGMSSPYS